MQKSELHLRSSNPCKNMRRRRAHARYCRQTLSTWSFPPDATELPSGLQSTVYTSSACPGRSIFSFLEATSQTCITIKRNLSLFKAIMNYSYLVLC